MDRVGCGLWVVILTSFALFMKRIVNVALLEVCEFIKKKNTQSMHDFSEFIQNGECRDNPLSNAKFTCTSGLENPILCWLDRFIVTGDREDLCPHYFQEALPKVTSNHWPIMLNTAKLSFGPKPFRFENMWTTHQDFKNLVEKWWNECDEGKWKGFRFMKKLQFIKKRLTE